MNFEITANEQLTGTVWRMTLRGDASALTAPGQFVQVSLPGFFLRRPISVCDWDAETVTLVYKVVGQGTAAMAAMEAGTKLDLLTGLGNGFSVEACGDRPLLIGGGVGLPPMLGLCKALLRAGRAPRLLAGFGKADECFLLEDFAALGVQVTVTTLDGSRGVQGVVTDAMPGLDYDSVCACGPLPMLKAVWRQTGGMGQYSLEERMGCGFGACMGCTIQTRTGSKRVCKEGPVFDGGELMWE